MTARAAAPITIRSSPASSRRSETAAAARRCASVVVFAFVVLSSAPTPSPLLSGCHARPSSSLGGLSSAAGRRKRGGGGRSAGNGGGGGGCRTVLTFRRPTPERTGRRMFGGDDEELRFNHDSVGLTNPCLHVAVPASASTTSASAAAPADEDDDVDASSEGWWFPPPAAVSELGGSVDGEYGGGGGGGGRGGEWRVLRYRRRVGSGERCYSAVRDAALEWEFREVGPGGESLGILKAPLRRSSPSPSATPSGDCRFLWRRRSEPGVRFGNGGGMEGRRHIAGCDVYDNVPVNDCGGIAEPLVGETARNVLQIWPSGGGTTVGSRPGRRLVTYSETKFLGGNGGGSDDDCSSGAGDTSFGSRLRRRLPRLPSLYAANPVAVVYDLVDQSGPGATYTSTAYATLRGHLLSGEERVTVAFRNGRRGSSGDGAANLAASGTRFGGSAADDDEGGAVDVEILSYSRAAPSILGRLAWPLIGRMQDRFFRTQLDALERVARKENASGDGTGHRGPCLLKMNGAQ